MNHYDIIRVCVGIYISIGRIFLFQITKPSKRHIHLDSHCLAPRTLTAKGWSIYVSVQTCSNSIQTEHYYHHNNLLSFNRNLGDHEIGTQTACKYRPFRFLFYGKVDLRHRHWLLYPITSLLLSHWSVPLALILSSFTKFSAVADTSKSGEMSLTPKMRRYAP